ncbi:hypothetical protein ABPG72_011876 [Tetrahymena utriculariae]
MSNQQNKAQQQSGQQNGVQGIPQQVQSVIQNAVNGQLQNQHNPNQSNAAQASQQQNHQQQQHPQQNQQQPVNAVNDQNSNQQNANSKIQLANLNLKCQEHEQNPIVGICFAHNCEYQSRLLCLQCIFSSHAEHVKYSVQLQEIDESDKNGVFMDNWPTQSVCKDIRKFIKKSQQGSYNNLEQKVENLKQQATKNFQDVQNIIKERTKNVSLSKETEIAKINQQAAKMYKLGSLKQNLKDYSDKKINGIELNHKIKEFSLEKPNDEDLHLLSNTFMQIKQNQELIFLPHEFDKIQNEILKLINSIPSQTLLANTINFYPSPYKDSSEFFKVGDKGTLLSFEKDSNTAYTICVSDNLRKNSFYELEIKIEGDYANNKLRFSIVKEEFIDEIPQNLYYCVVRGSNDMQGEFFMHGQEWLHVKNLKNTLKIKICIAQNVFIMQSADERGGVKLMNYKFNCSNSTNWRLMIINSGKPIKIYKISSSVDHS